VEESIRVTEDRGKWRQYVHGEAKPRIEDGCIQTCCPALQSAPLLMSISAHLTPSVTRAAICSGVSAVCIYHTSTFTRHRPVYSISYHLSYDYLNCSVRASYGSHLQRAKISRRNDKLICERYLRRSYDLASELYLKSLASFVSCFVN